MEPERAIALRIAEIWTAEILGIAERICAAKETQPTGTARELLRASLAPLVALGLTSPQMDEPRACLFVALLLRLASTIVQVRDRGGDVMEQAAAASDVLHATAHQWRAGMRSVTRACSPSPHLH
jgi:hypothetical protein